MPLTLFGGTLKVFDEDSFALQWFGWWKAVCASFSPVNYVYIIGVVIAAVLIVKQRDEFGKAIQCMKQRRIMGKRLYVCESSVTPFSAGLLKPKIVIPDIICKTYSRQELAIILKHEEIHIRLGHLWFYGFWDLLKIVFWFNPLIYVCLPYFQQDMEDICDTVSIQHSGCAPYDYGKLLFKSMQVLTEKNMNGLPALLGKSDYDFFKERMLKITRYKPYKKETAVILISCCLLTAISGGYFLHTASYPRYTMIEMITVFDIRGTNILIDDMSGLNAVYYDKENLYINNKQFLNVLNAREVENRELYIGINGYEKTPHWGSGMDCIYVDCSKFVGSTTQIPYGKYDAVTGIVQWIIKEVL
ncbi:M56 family metallopeptidase [Acetonema longum]|nr:M56 family metallopeptidase [Acetonema longum]